MLYTLDPEGTADTRSRREVVGQMLEYAANGHHYWDRAGIRRYLEETAARAGRSMEQRFAELGPDGRSTPRNATLSLQNDGWPVLASLRSPNALWMNLGETVANCGPYLGL